MVAGRLGGQGQPGGQRAAPQRPAANWPGSGRHNRPGPRSGAKVAGLIVAGIVAGSNQGSGQGSGINDASLTAASESDAVGTTTTFLAGDFNRIKVTTQPRAVYAIWRGISWQNDGKGTIPTIRCWTVAAAGRYTASTDFSTRQGA